MAVHYVSLLSLLLVVASAFSTRVTTSRDDPLQYWLEDPVARRGLLDAWHSGSSPLASAFNAFNASSSASDVIQLPSFIISVGCAHDVHNLLHTRALWAFRMIDSSVKTPVGLLAGVRTHFGNWDECVNVRGIPSTYMDRTFNGQMCMLGLRAQSISRADDVYDVSFTRRASPSSDLHPSTVLANLQVSMGVCVPDSCSAGDVLKLFEILLANLKIVDGIELVPSVSDADCTTKDAPDMDSGDMIAVMVLSILAALVVMSTVYDVVTPAEERLALPAAFSVISNGRKLLELPRANADHTLSCLHGLRFLSMCWVVLYHRYHSPLVLPIVNPSFVQYMYQDFFHMFFLNGSLCVDTFFVLSGLLLAYLFFKQETSKQRLNIPMYYLHRYIRLTPALAMTVLLTATLLLHTGWGPYSSKFLVKNKILCQDNWWNTILYVNNYVKPSETCVDQSWYLMVDMQLHWLSPLVLLPLVWMPKVGMVWLIILSLGGTLHNFLVLYLQDTSGNGDHSSYIAYVMTNMYGFTHTHFVPYLIGIATGYILANRSKGSEDKKPLPILISCVAWVIAAGLLLAAFLSYNIYLEEPAPSQLASTLYEAFERPTWALGIASLVYLCAIGHGGGVNVFLSWWGFHILGRLSYSAYLVHVAWQTFQTASMKYLFQTGDAEMLTQFCGDLVGALLFGAVLYLVCEAPFLVLERELLGGKKGKKSDKSNVSGTVQPSSTPSSFLPSAPNAEVSKETLDEIQEVKPNDSPDDSHHKPTYLTVSSHSSTHSNT